MEEELRTNESRYINWLVFDVNPARDILGQIAAIKAHVERADSFLL